MGLFNLAKKSVKELIEDGYPESVAKKIADGTLPMDEASREARANLMNMTDDKWYRGHRANKPPKSNEDMFMARDRPDIAETYAGPDRQGVTGVVTPLRTNASKFIEADGMGDDWTYPTARIPGIGEGVGTDEISRLTKMSRERYGNDLQGSLFTDVTDDIGGKLPAGDVANILGSQPEVKIRHAEKAAFDPEYDGPSIMGGVLAGGVGLGALGQSEDADASVASLAKRGLEIASSDGNLFSVIQKGPDVGPRREVAYAEMGSNLDGGLSARDMAVAPDYRGNGLMGETYDAIEEITDKQITPSNWLTDDGAKFWVKRDRQLIEDMYNDGQFDWDDGFNEKVGGALEGGNADPRLLAGTAAGTAGLLAAGQSEDADAGVSFGLAKNVDMDRLISTWRKAVSREPDINPSTHLQNIIHNKEFTNYDDWTKYARQQDGGKNGDTYFNELKPFLLDISKHPSVTKDNRLKRGLVEYADSRFVQRKKAGKQPSVRAVGAPGADDGLLAAQLNNHDEAVDQHMQNLGIDPREDSMYEYGSLLPVRENIVTGKSEMAMPTMVRDMIRGLLDISESRKSGVYRPDGLVEFL